MFRVHCAGHGRDVILTERNVRLVNLDPGILVAWTCPCGTEGAYVTGKGVEQPA
jgi:hypothetical protein